MPTQNNKKTARSTSSKRRRQKGPLFSIPQHISEIIDESYHQLQKQFPPLKQAANFLEKNFQFISDQQYRLPFVGKAKKTGGKRKKKSDLLANLTHKGPFQKIQEFGTKQIIAPLNHLGERVQHSFNLPSRSDFERLHQQIKELDEKIDQLHIIEHGSKSQHTSPDHSTSASTYRRP